MSGATQPVLAVGTWEKNLTSWALACATGRRVRLSAMAQTPQISDADGARAPLVAALTDYGAGPYRAMLEASVRYPHAPGVQWLDIDHAVALGDVRSGALTLRRVLPSLPTLRVRGRGRSWVGTARRAIAARAASGHLLVGPDNGLLEPALRRLGA